MTCFCFVRHGETEANRSGRISGRTDLGLNQNGVCQARQTAEKLKGATFDAVYCGNLKRVRETFEIIRPSIRFAEEHLYYNENIREVDFGEWENMTAGEIESRYPQEWAAYLANWTDYAFPGGEVNRAYFERCSLFIWNIAKKHAGGRVAVFGHKGFILACVCALRGLPVERMFETDIANGSFFLMNLDE